MLGLKARGWNRVYLSVGSALLIAAASAAAPAPAPARPQPVRVGGLTLRLLRTEVERTATTVLSGAGAATATPERSAAVTLELAITTPTPALLATVQRGPVAAEGFRVVDDLGKEAREVRVEVVEREDSPVLRVTARGLSTRAVALRAVEVALPLYPQARVVRFHVPWLKDETPLTTEAGGGAKATLRRFQLVEEDSTLWISIRPPDGLRVAPFEQPGAIDARAWDIYGNLVNGGAITRIELARAGEEPELRFFAPALRRTPSRLTLDVLCVSGSARPERFTLRHLPLPR